MIRPCIIFFLFKKGNMMSYHCKCTVLSISEPTESFSGRLGPSLTPNSWPGPIATSYQCDPRHACPPWRWKT
ncbi:hypothetical protein HZ326_18665 [Fusarium oxysporum f. sp. albedinis]|nr:hypothetical protein HZ326_18665 [Fusarium oxysporum f. sp. albedinis]